MFLVPVLKYMVFFWRIYSKNYVLPFYMALFCPRISIAEKQKWVRNGGLIKPTKTLIGTFFFFLISKFFKRECQLFSCFITLYDSQNHYLFEKFKDENNHVPTIPRVAVAVWKFWLLRLRFDLRSVFKPKLGDRQNTLIKKFCCLQKSYPAS